jgi:hypothetical protein
MDDSEISWLKKSKIHKVLDCSARCSVVFKALCLFIVTCYEQRIVVLIHYATSWKVADSIPGEVDFSTYLILPAILDPGVYSTYNRNEYQK